MAPEPKRLGARQPTASVIRADFLWFVASPASGGKAGTRADRSVQYGAGAKLRSHRVQDQVRQRFGQDAPTYSARNAAYDLAKMVGKMLVRRIERSRRYAVDPPGLRTLCAYLLLREKVIKPLLAGVVRPRGRPPKVVAPLDQHYVALRDELQRTFQTIGLA